ncbi:unnamed protein product, partial [Mesorhabditis spiculigera]
MFQEQCVTFGNKTLTIVKPVSSCRYRSVAHNSGVDDFQPKYGPWLVIKGAASDPIEDEFVQVECYKQTFGMERCIYRNTFFQVVPRETSSETGKPFPKDAKDRPSVLFLGIDGVSRSNFIRQLPQTMEVMERQGFVTLDDYAKLGDNSFPNLCAILLGKRGYDAADFPSEVPTEWGINYDNWTDFVWRRFGRAGYATMFSEDRPEWSTFSYKKHSHGFVKRPPTDHYQRPYFTTLYDSKEMLQSTPQCFDRSPLHNLQLDYVKEFLTAYHSRRIPTFTFFWNVDLAHEYLNTLKVADSDLAGFLQDNQELLENTIVLMISDH